MALSGRGTGRHPAPWETKECWPSFSDTQLLPEEASSTLLLLNTSAAEANVCVFVCVRVSLWNEGHRWRSQVWWLRMLLWSLCLLPRLLNNVHWELLSISPMMYKTNVGILCSLIYFLSSRQTSNVRYNGMDLHYNMYIWHLKGIILPKYIYY